MRATSKLHIKNPEHLSAHQIPTHKTELQENATNKWDTTSLPKVHRFLRNIMKKYALVVIF